MIVNEKLDIERIIEECKHPLCGCEVIFLGFVRGRHSEDFSHNLEIECYREMAEKEIEKIEKIVENKFEIQKCKIVHRVGKLQTGEDIVCIVISSPHRADAFDACRYAIDELKKLVPIWKRE